MRFAVVVVIAVTSGPSKRIGYSSQIDTIPHLIFLPAAKPSGPRAV